MGTRIVIDGLWRCLCPSFDASASSTILNVPSRVQASRALASRCLFRPLRQQTRSIHRPPNGDQARRKRSGHVIRRVDADSDSVACLLAAGYPYRELMTATTPDIYEALDRMKERPTRARAIAAFVQYLVKERGEPPSTALYEYLLLAHSHPHGSMDTVAELLKEMRTTRVQWSFLVYHNLLQVLAVHPNYLERNRVLREMRERWLDITPGGHQDIAIGLLRDGQYELALEKIDEMIRQGIRISPWVSDIFIYVFGQAGFVEEALRIVHHRLHAESATISLNIWYFLLDVCSKQLHLDGTRYVWNRAVQLRAINPSDGMAINVLNTATRHKDPRLATQVIQYLTSRGTKLGVHHFEALIECYSLTTDVQNALQTLCIMAKAGLRPDEGSTRSIFQCLNTTDLVDQAIQVLGDLRVDNNVPLAAFNVVLEAALHKVDFDKALELYRHVQEICPTGPTLTTFKHLLGKCEEPEVVQFLLSEMDHFKVKRDSEADVRATEIFTLHGDLSTALHYFWDLTNVGRLHEISPNSLDWSSKRNVALRLLRRCVEETGSDSVGSKRLIEACRANCLVLDTEIQLLEGKISKEDDNGEGIAAAGSESRELVGQELTHGALGG